MAVYTDNPQSAAGLLPAKPTQPYARPGVLAADMSPLLGCLFGDAGERLWATPLDVGWGPVFVRHFAPASQFDGVIALARSGAPLPERFLCLARTGSGFHGARARAWSALSGNIHLTAFLRPDRPIPRFDSVFTALAAVAVADAADSVPDLAGRARIKWVNDVLIGDAKIGGVLAYTQTRGEAVSCVVLGIGMNVEAAPVLEATSFVSRAACLRDYARDAAAVHVPAVLRALIASLRRNYGLLLAHGHTPILEQYRARSAVLGADVAIREDRGEDAPLLAAGRVLAIGDGLELHLSGRTEPVRRGRVVRCEAAYGSP